MTGEAEKYSQVSDTPRNLGWISLCLGVVLGIYAIGGGILSELGRRYRDFAVYTALGTGVLFSILFPLFLLACVSRNGRQFRWLSFFPY